MISDFNYFKQPEQPVLILCNPDDTELGIITSAEDVSLNIRFNDISDLNYKIYQSEDVEYNDDVYDKHIERRQVSVAGVGYFIITSVVETEDELGVYKSIQAKSCEYELNNISAPYINGTYCLYKPENFEEGSNEQIAQREEEYLNKNCILYEVMKTIPSWKLEQIRFVENEKYQTLASTFRTFESSDTTIYSLLKSEIQKNYDCFVEFDIQNRIIRILHYDDVFVEEPVILSKANVLNSCEVSTTIDNYVNTLNVEGQDGVSIASCNPMGNSLIYNFDHDIAIGLIDGVLKDALIYWKNNLRTNPNVELSDGTWFLLPEFVSEWESFNSTLLRMKKNILDTINNGTDKGLTGQDLYNYAKEQASYREIFEEDLSWWYYWQYLSEESQSFEVDGRHEDFFTALGSILIPADLLENADYIKRVESFFNQNADYAKSLFLRDIAIGSFEVRNSETESSTITDIGECNRLVLCMQSALNNVATEISLLESYIKGYEAQLASISTTQIEEKADPTALNEQKEMLEKYIESTNKSKAIYENINAELSETINVIQTQLGDIYSNNQFENSFSKYLNEHTEIRDTADNLYTKLTRYFKQQTYTNDTIIVTDAMSNEDKYTQEKDLYNESVRLLETLSIPAYEVVINAESFMFSPEFKSIIDDMSIKSAFYVELPSNDVPLFHLLEININYDERNCELKFGNRLNLSNPAAILSELQATASSAASIVAAERINWGIREDKINLLMEAKSADIDTTFRMMKNSINNTSLGADGLRCYAIDEDGNPTYGFWGANGVLMFTDETDTPKMAIGRILRNDGESDYYEYGLYGQSIIANTITADKLIAGALSRGSNYIRNGSFEAYEADTLHPAHWISTVGGALSLEANEASLGSRYCVSKTSVGGGSGESARALGPPIMQITYTRLSQTLSVPLLRGDYCLSFYYTGIPEYNNSETCVAIVYNDEMVASCDATDNSTDIPVGDTVWKRCNKCFHISDNISSAEVVVICPVGVCIDGVMLEQSSILHEYSPHLSETYAKYTTIDDNGVTVYNGKIKILNNAGSTVFEADDDGNLVLTGAIKASNGEIGGWTIDNDRLYNGHSGMSTSGDNIFYAGESEDTYNFKVSNTGKLFARDADIEGTITADNGRIGNWTVSENGLSGGKLILENGNYRMEIDGYGIRAGLKNSSGVYTESDFGMSMTLQTTSNNIFNPANKDNLALAGKEVVSIGRRTNGSYIEMGRFYNYTYSGNTGNPFSQETLEIEAIKAQRLIIGGKVYTINAYESEALANDNPISNPAGRYLALTLL